LLALKKLSDAAALNEPALVVDHLRIVSPTAAIAFRHQEHGAGVVRIRY